jgi:hypothetical protein
VRSTASQPFLARGTPTSVFVLPPDCVSFVTLPYSVSWGVVQGRRGEGAGSIGARFADSLSMRWLAV